VASDDRKAGTLDADHQAVHTILEGYEPALGVSGIADDFRRFLLKSH
jgi:hypothetical protein